MELIYSVSTDRQLLSSD